MRQWLILLVGLRYNFCFSWTLDASSKSRRQVLVGGGTAALVGFSSLPAASDGTTTAISPIATLSDGSRFPLASFGLQIYDDDTAYKLTLTALEVGYRNFFASVLARNQKGFAKAIKDSGIDRGELYICGSVVSNRVDGFDAAKKLTTQGWLQNMDKFSNGDIDYLDQIMLDYPGPSSDAIRGQWESFEEMHSKKLVKSLSVSNFSPVQLDYVINAARVAAPVVNQLPYSVAYHPGNSIQENSKRDVLVQAWAPLGGSIGGRFTSSMKGQCGSIGKRYGKSYAQVALRWIVQSGGSFTTQSKSKDHFAQDLNIFDFELSADEMKVLGNLA